MRIGTIAILLSSLLVSVFCTVIFINKQGYETYLLAAITLAQVSSSGLVFILVIFFSRKELGAKGLTRKANEFLETEITERLEKIDWHKTFGAPGPGQLQVTAELPPNGLICNYVITVPNAQLLVRIVFNIRRFVVIYYLSPEIGSEEQINALFAPTIRGAQSTGYTYAVRLDADPPFGSERFAALYFYKEGLASDFLLDPLEKLFWSQDISLMTRDVLINYIGSGLPRPPG